MGSRGRSPRQPPAPAGLLMGPLTLEVVQHSLAGIAEEMGATLRRTARSPNITEREDASCALTTPAGEMCAQAEHIPVHLGAMPASVAAALEEFPDPVEGDSVLLNDPFAGGTHLNDLTLVSPVFDDGVLLGFVANRAHHADVGGKVPGSMPGDSTDIYQEGLRLPPVLAWRRGVPQDTILKVIAANSRAPAERWGDLLAQAGANATGAARLRALARRIGAGALSEAMEALIEYSERAVRAGIAALPNGEWTFEDYLDSDGAGSPPVRIQATVRIDGDELEVDFSGTDAQARGNVNAPLAVTVSAVTFVVRAVTGPDIPPTAGGMRPVTVVAPPGTVVNALAPAAVSAGNVETSQRIVDVLFGALARRPRHPPRRRGPLRLGDRLVADRSPRARPMGPVRGRSGRPRPQPAPAGRHRDRTPRQGHPRSPQTRHHLGPNPGRRRLGQTSVCLRTYSALKQTEVCRVVLWIGRVWLG